MNYIYAQNDNEAAALIAILKLENWSGGDTKQIGLKYNIHIPWADEDCGEVKSNCKTLKPYEYSL